jgi:hypothetical protein
MRIAFTHFGVAEEIALVMIESVRKHMPNVIITQLSDMTSRRVYGVDEIRRVDARSYPYLLYKHMSELPTPFIRVDYDMIFQGDITHILDDDIDLAMNLHGDPKVLGSKWGKAYPYATCIWGAKNKAKEFAEDFRNRHMESRRDDWLGLIPSVNEVLVTGKYRVKALPGEIYNYTPIDRHDRPKDALVIHYKGNRKHWMLPFELKSVVARDEQRVLAKVLESDRKELFLE